MTDYSTDPNRIRPAGGSALISGVIISVLFIAGVLMMINSTSEPTAPNTTPPAATSDRPVQSPPATQP